MGLLESIKNSIIDEKNVVICCNILFLSMSIIYYWIPRELEVLKKHNVQYAQTALTQRLNSLANLEHSSTVSHDYIQDRISNSSFYRNQLAFRDRRKI